MEWAHPLAVVRLPAEVDVLNADQVRDTLLAVLNQGITTLVVDMTGTSYCGVAGVGALARAQQRAQACGAAIRVAAPAPIVRRVLAVVRADRAISVFPTLAEAIGGAIEDAGEITPNG